MKLKDENSPLAQELRALRSSLDTSRRHDEIGEVTIPTMDLLLLAIYNKLLVIEAALKAKP